jgi:selenocysteine lyase/cysteine desulfurase
MTPQELRADIPALQERSYLNYGAHGPSPGDVVVRADLEHPAGILPWKHLEREAIKIRVSVPVVSLEAEIDSVLGLLAK